MQNCSNNPISNNQGCYPIQGPNAVSINIISPQAYGTAPCSQSQQIPNYYPMYGVNPNPGFIYPSNYNNFFPSNSLNAFNNEKLPKKAVEEPIEEKKEEDKKTEEEKTKKITPLTNEYVQSLENYLNNDNPKIRLIGAKELMERFKRGDESRNTEGSGLGLAIAKDLVKLMEGVFEITIDGDLFKVTIVWKGL